MAILRKTKKPKEKYDNFKELLKLFTMAYFGETFALSNFFLHSYTSLAGLVIKTMSKAGQKVHKRCNPPQTLLENHLRLCEYVLCAFILYSFIHLFFYRFTIPPFWMGVRWWLGYGHVGNTNSHMSLDMLMWKETGVLQSNPPSAERSYKLIANRPEARFECPIVEA